MKKHIVLALLFLMSFSVLFKGNSVFAATCTQSGSTAYCTDTSTGKTTTYNQWGNIIYGSDGSSYTMYGDTTYGGGNVFRTGGNSGSSLRGVSAAGADLNSPEMIAAKAKYDAACATSASNEVIIGGTHANNCREAVTEWLRALSNSQKTNATAPAPQPANYNSGRSTSQDDVNEIITKMHSIFGNTSDTKPVNQCVSMGFPNSHQEGNNCFCDIGYTQSGNKCVPLTIESCEAIAGPGAIPVQGTNSCQCNTGYTLNSSRMACIATPPPADINVVNPPPVQQIKTEVKDVPIIKKKPIPKIVEIETIATSTATSTVNLTMASSSSPTSTPITNKSLWKKLLSWFRW